MTPDLDAAAESSTILRDRERTERALDDGPYVRLGGRDYRDSELPDASDLLDAP